MDFKSIIKIIFLVLILENAYFYVAIFAQNSSSNLLQIVFYVDIVCYALLSVFLILQGLTFKKNDFIISGVFFIVWIGFTLAWRLTLNVYSTIINVSNTQTISNTFSTVVDLFIVGGGAFLLAIYFMSKTIDFSHNQRILFNVYGVVNFLSVVATAAIYGIFFKLLLVPVLGIIAYALAFNRISKTNF